MCLPDLLDVLLLLIPNQLHLSIMLLTLNCFEKICTNNVYFDEIPTVKLDEKGICDKSYKSFSEAISVIHLNV